MAQLRLQMMMTIDGMVSGPRGELDWMANDEQLERDHLAKLKEAELLVLGAGVIPEMSTFWLKTESDQSTTDVMREIGRLMNDKPKVVYSHHEMPIEWRNAQLHVVPNDDALVEDVKRLKRESAGIIMTYGGVRMARTLLQQKLVDELELDICPIVLGTGQPLFTDQQQRSQLRLRESSTYKSGTTMVHYNLTSPVTIEHEEPQDQAPPTPSPELHRLDRLVGTWRLKGRPIGSDQDSITGTATFKWLHQHSDDGGTGMFLQQDVEMDYAGTQIHSHELIGYNPKTGAFSSCVYSNMAAEPWPYEWDIQGNTWTISINHGPMNAKFTGKLSADGKSFSGGWRPRPGADESINAPYDIRGSLVDSGG
jgi:dihydrofolate reductase